MIKSKIIFLLLIFEIFINVLNIFAESNLTNFMNKYLYELTHLEPIDRSPALESFSPDSFVPFDHGFKLTIITNYKIKNIKYKSNLNANIEVTMNMICYMDLIEGFIIKNDEKNIIYKIKKYSNDWKIYYMNEDSAYRYYDNGLKYLKERIADTEKAVATGYYSKDILLKYKKLFKQFKKFNKDMKKTKQCIK